METGDKDRVRLNKSTQINRTNKVEILGLIWRQPEISRAEISRTTGLSAPAVSRIVDNLISGEELVKDLGADAFATGAGRRPNLLFFDGNDRYIVGADLGYDLIRSVVCDLNAKVIAEEKIPAEPEKGFLDAMRRMIETILRVIAASGIDEKRLCGLGMAVTGLSKRIKYFPGKTEGGAGYRYLFPLRFPWTEGNVEVVFEGLPDIPMIIDNVSRTTARGELLFGQGREFSEFISVNVRRGSVCSGVVLNGCMLKGVAARGGGMGHITVDKNSRIRCACGNYGCLEALVTGAGLEASAREKMANDRSSVLWELCGGDPAAVTEIMIVKAARQNDPVATEVYRDAAEYIGIGVAAMINIFDPKAIFVGGREVSQAGDPFFERIRQTAMERAVGFLAEQVQILPMKLGAKTTVMGAVALVLEKILALDLPVPRRRQ